MIHTDTHFEIVTAPNPGAIGIIQLTGPQSQHIISKLTGLQNFSNSQLAEIDGIDEGLILKLKDNWYQLMPHGGPRVIQRITESLINLGITQKNHTNNLLTYPEAQNNLQADMLATLAQAASPLAIDLLLEQPTLWQNALSQNDTSIEKLREQSTANDYLNIYITPPTVVLCGAANVGKSTLSNLILGTQSSITADLPGTTRDWVGGLGILPTNAGEFAVKWIDTPGIRQSDDLIEQHAIAIAKNVIQHAGGLIQIDDPDTADTNLPLTRKPDLRFLNKSDLLSLQDQNKFKAAYDLIISANNPSCINPIGNLIHNHFAQNNNTPTNLWAFATPLQNLIQTGNLAQLKQYAGLNA